MQQFSSYNTSDTMRENLYGERVGVWYAHPSMSSFRLDNYPIRRGPNLAYAARYTHDWQFEQVDKGAFTVTLDGSSRAKDNLVIALRSHITDALGFYVIVGKQGVQVVRRLPGEVSPIDPGSYMRENIEEVAGTLRSIPAPLQKADRITFSVVYVHGKISVYEHQREGCAMDVASPTSGKLVVEFIASDPTFGVRQWGLGLYGASNGDTLTVESVKKWTATPSQPNYYGFPTC